jgi:hypothetical protein
MATSAVLRYNMNKITCYLDHARVAKCSASSGFNSAGAGPRMRLLGLKYVKRWRVGLFMHLFIA